MVFAMVNCLVLLKRGRNVILSLAPLWVLEKKERLTILMGDAMVKLKESMKVHSLENHLVLKKEKLMVF